jgi:hypothetical protein
MTVRTFETEERRVTTSVESEAARKKVVASASPHADLSLRGPIMSYKTAVCEVGSAPDARSDGSPMSLRRDASPPLFRSPYSIEELSDAGFTPQELKEAGCDFPSLKAAGFSLTQLKDAGYEASAFINDGCNITQLRGVGFTARELTRCGCDFPSMKAVGFSLKQLKDAGFSASAFERDGCSVAQLREVGFTAGELLNPNAHAVSQATRKEFQSSYHDEIKKEVQEKLQHARIFGDSWLSFLGFFAPFGCANSFWNRLKNSRTFKHVFVYDEQCVQKLGKASLCDQLAAPRVTAADVDGSVNNICLICALVLGCPLLMMGEMSSNEGRWTTFMHGLIDQSNDNRLCLPSVNFTQLYSEYCLSSIQHWFKRLYVVTLLSFYSALATLNMALFYYMCRPSECSNSSSLITLMEAFKLEAREKIRLRRGQPPSGALTSLDSSLDEIEVFLNAKFLAENELEEQKNQGFYIWYKREWLRAQAGMAGI